MLGSRSWLVCVRACLLVMVLVLGDIACADSHLSTDPQVRKARNLVENGKYQQALEILRPLRKVHADQTDVLFLIGFASLQAASQAEEGDAKREALLDEAIGAFHEILVDKPSLVRVRLELARAFFLKGEDALSRKHFEQVKAGDQPQAMLANIDLFLRNIRARRGWDASFGLAIAPDTNIGANSTSRTIYIFGLPFVLDDEDTVSSGVGFSVWGGLVYQFPLNDRLLLRTGFDLSRREYQGHEFDRTSAVIKAGPRWLVSDDTVVDVLFNVSQSWAGKRRDFIDNGISTEIARNFNSRSRGKALFSWAMRRYHREPHNDGPLKAATLSATYLINPIVRTELEGGYIHHRPDTYRQRNSTVWTALGVSVALPKGYALGVRGKLSWVDFRGDWTPFVADNLPRKERTRSVRLSVYNRSLTWYGFSPQLALINERRKSNAQLYDYQRNRAELSFIRQF